jgi:hypothetical protein
MQLCTKAGGDERMKENVAARWREGEGPERRHPLARRAPTRTSVSAWWWSPGPGVAGAAPARVERRRDRGGVGWVWVVRSGAERGRGGGACGSDAIERSGRKKGHARVLYPLMFVGPTHQPTNISYICQILNR